MINFHLERQSVSLAPWGVELQPMCKHVSSPQAKLINPVADHGDDMADSLHTETLMEWSQYKRDIQILSINWPLGLCKLILRA